jgi:cell division protein FtsI/penicillin-binding protein 2
VRRRRHGDRDGRRRGPDRAADGSDTDAWMAAFAPADGGGDPVAVGVLRRGDGQGAETAAPVARAILTAALR